MKKRLISIAVVLSIIASLFTFNIYSNAATTDTNINKNLLEGMLNNRSWVIDTLINDDYSTNPHAIVNGINDERSMMATALSQYENEDDPLYSPAYKAMVDTLNTWYHAGDYASDIANLMANWAADVIEFFGGSESATSSLRNAADTAKNMQYDNILQEVLKADYTASSGQTLSGSNSQLVQLRKISDGVGMITSFISATKSITGLDSATAESTSAYVNDVLIPTADSYEAVMNNVAKVTGADVGEEEQALLDLSKALGMALVYDSIVIDSDTSGAAVSIAPQYLLDDSTKMLIDLGSNMANFASNTMDSYMYISSIQTQKESVAGVMDRTAAHLANADTIKLLNRYSGLIKDAADKKTSNYTYIATMLRNSGTLTKYTEKKTSEALKSMATRFIPCYEESIIPSALASVTGVIGTATYLGDGVTGIKDTSTKTLELKNLNELIRLFKATYDIDMKAYKANPTEENAAKVIDDLEFIQRLRLRGETIAYNMSKNQLEKPLGQIIAGASEEIIAEEYAHRYQTRVDSIIGASVVPFSTDTFTVKDGETLSVYYDSSLGGLWGRISSTKYTRGVAELNYRLNNGITVASGGTLHIVTNEATTCIPYIINNGGTVRLIGSAKILELAQNSGETILGEAVSHIEHMTLNGGTLVSYQRDNISCDYLENTGGTATLEIPVYCNELSVKGRINGSTVYLKGDSDGGGGIIQNLYLNGTSAQTMRNVTGAENITYDNPNGITQEGTVKVSGTLKNINTKLKNAKNTVIVDGGKIDGGYYKQDITISGKMSDEFVEFDSIVYVSGAASIGSAKINNMLYQTSGSLNINGDLEILDTAKLQGSVSQTAGDFILRGNVSFSSSANLNNLVVCGSKAQSISGTITVNDYTNKNTAGLTIGGKINVKGKAKSVKAPTSGASNVTLIDNSGFAESKYYGDITIGNRSDSIPDLAKVYGSIYINGNITQSEADTIIYAIDMNGGNLVIKDCTLNLKNRFTLNSGTIALQNANVICNAVFNPSSTVTIDENSKLEIYSDLINKGTMSGNGTVKVSGNITNSGTMNVGKLILTAESDRNVSGNAITVKEFQATGSKAVNLSNTINVSEGFDLGNVQKDASKIKYTTSMSVTSDSTFKDDLFLKSGLDITNADVKLKGNLSVENNSITLSGADLKADKNITITSGNLVVGENSKVTCSGKLSITNGNITVSDNSTLMVRKNADLSNVNITLGNNSKIIFYSKFSVSGSSSNSITIDATSSLTSKNLMNVNILGNITVNGELILGGDAILKSTALSGSGTATLYGDLYTTSTTSLLLNTFKISGKFAQRINGSGLAFNNLTINNNSSAGVTFDSATYQGELITGSSIVNGSLTAVE